MEFEPKVGDQNLRKECEDGQREELEGRREVGGGHAQVESSSTGYPSSSTRYEKEQRILLRRRLDGVF